MAGGYEFQTRMFESDFWEDAVICLAFMGGVLAFAVLVAWTVNWLTS